MRAICMLSLLAVLATAAPASAGSDIGDVDRIPLDRPLGPMAYGAGALWVVDLWDASLIRVDADSGVVTERAVVLPPAHAWNLDVAGGAIYVANYIDAEPEGPIPPGTVTKFDAADGAELATWSTHGHTPTGIDVRDGKVWIANHRTDDDAPPFAQSSVVALDAVTGEELLHTRVGAQQWCCGAGQLVATGDGAWATVYNIGSTVFVPADGGPVSAVSTGDANDEGGCGFLAADASHVWVSETFCRTYEVSRIDQQTRRIDQRLRPGGPAFGIAVRGQDLWMSVLDMGRRGRSGNLVRFDKSSGRLKAKAPTHGGAGPVVSGGGYVWAQASGSGEILRITP